MARNVYIITMVGRNGTAEIVGKDEDDARKRFKRQGYSDNLKIKTIKFDRVMKSKKKGE